MIIRVTTTFLWYGQQMQNVMHFNNRDGVLSLSQCADDIQTNWVNRVRVQIDDDGKFTAITVRNMDNLTVAPFTKAISILGGADHGNQQVPYLSMVLQIYTGVAGKHGRGRIYLPGVSWAHTQNGTFTAQAFTDWNSATCLNAVRAAYLSPSGTSNLVLGVRNRSDGTFLSATELLIRTVPGVQRRRNIGVGI